MRPASAHKLFDQSCTERWHLHVMAIQLVGKEANRWEEQFFLDLAPEAQSENGIAAADRDRMLAAIQQAAKHHGAQALADCDGLSRRPLSTILICP